MIWYHFFMKLPVYLWRFFVSSIYQRYYSNLLNVWCHKSLKLEYSRSLIVFYRAGNSLICSSLICSIQMSDCERFAQIAQEKWSTVSESLRLLKTNERLWANRSGSSWQMSDHERFAQVAHDKWANEHFAKKYLAKKSKFAFLVCFIYVFLFKKLSNSLIPSF